MPITWRSLTVLRSSYCLMLLFLGLNACAITADAEEMPLVQNSQMQFDRTALIPASGEYFTRGYGPIFAREAPGEQFIAPYQLRGKSSFKALSKFADKTSAVWYELDLGEGRSGFVSASFLLSRNRYEKAALAEELSLGLLDWVEGARSKSRGPFVKYTGFYSSSKECKTDSTMNPEQYLQQTSYVWFDGYKMSVLTFDATAREMSKITANQLKPFKSSDPNQWYTWGPETVAFEKGRMLRDPRFEKGGVRYKWSDHCDDVFGPDEADFSQIITFNRALQEFVRKLPTE